MELINNPATKNFTARFGLSFLFASYCLVAIFTSVPQNKASHGTVTAFSKDVVLPPQQSFTLAGLAESARGNLPASPSIERNWWQQHRSTGILRGKWWQQHATVLAKPAKSVEVARLGELTGSKPVEKSRDEAVNTQIAAGNSTPLVDHTIVAKAISQSLSNSAKEPIKSVGIKPVDVKSVADTSVEAKPGLAKKQAQGAGVSKGLSVKPAVSVFASTSSLIVAKRPLFSTSKSLAQPVLDNKGVAAEKREPSVAKPLQAKNNTPVERATPDREASATLAGLIPSKDAMAKPFDIKNSAKKATFNAYDDQRSLVVKTVLHPVVKPENKEQVVHQCVADNIAGWSGVKLLEKHKILIKRSDSKPLDVSAGLKASLAAKGFTAGASIFLRIFKDKSELQVWLKKDDRYALFHTYKICRWSGSFGPKLYEGDKQSPEGFYRVNRQLFTRQSWKWKDSFSIGYPNAYDKLHGRTGSLILVHGGCTSSGCFAMTNPVIKEVHELAQLARENGQKNFSVHVYPFKLNKANLRKYKNSPWRPFWNNLKEGYDLFEKTGLPPMVKVCNKRYVFAPGGSERAGAGWSGKGCYGLEAYIPGWRPARGYASRRHSKKSRRSVRSARRAGVRARCNFNRPSCRKWVALKSKAVVKKSRRATKRRRVVKSTRTSGRLKKKRRASKRRATMRRARAIGKRQKRKSGTNNKYP